MNERPGIGVVVSEPAADYSVHYRHWHTEAPEHVAYMREEHRRSLAPLLEDVPRGSAADLGCGFGFAVLALQDLGFEAVGVERDAGQLAACSNIGAPAVDQDLREYLGEHHDLAVVTLLDVLEHMPVEDQIPILRQVRDALGPQGVVVLTVPNAMSPVMGHYRYIDHTHVTSFTVHSIRYVLQSAGFTDIHVEPSPKMRRWPVYKRDYLRGFVRLCWRMVLLAEIGREEGMTVPIDLNLTVRAS